MSGEDVKGLHLNWTFREGLIKKKLDQRLKRAELPRWRAGGRAIPAGATHSENALRWRQAWQVLRREQSLCG